MYRIKFKASADKRFSKFPKDIQIRIIQKLEFFLSQPNPLIYAEILTNPSIGTYRFRVGDYRVVFDLEDNETIMIVDVDHRKDIYNRKDIYR